MSSPFRRHQQKVRAQRAAGPVSAATIAPEIGGSDPAANDYRALLSALHVDLRALADVQSVEARAPLKREMARQYAAWVEGALAAGAEGKARQDEIVVTMMIWAMDYRDYDLALEIGEHVLTFGLALPDRYQRTAACLIAEDIATVALADPKTVSLDHLLRTAELTEKHDMPDQARAKLHKSIGRAYLAAANAFDPAAESAVAGGKQGLTASALAHFKRAIGLDRKIGVKKEIESLKRRVDESSKENHGGTPPA